MRRNAALLFAILPLVACSSDSSVSAIKSTLDIQPRFADVGQVPVNSTVDYELLLANTGPEITISEVVIDNHEGGFFALVTEDLPTVPEDGSELLIIRYSPSVPGAHWAEVTVYSNAENGPQSAQIIGEALLPAARAYPDHVDFGRVRPGETQDAYITVVNQGASELSVGSLVFDDPRFTLVDATPISIAPEGSTELTVRYAADSEAVASSVGALDLGACIVPVGIFGKANDCSTAAGAAYDLDGDGYSWCNADCNDDDAGVNPSMVEVCDGIDQDCDEVTDEGTECFDDDGDGYTEVDGDCNDTLDAVSPSTPEDFENGIDDDCDGVTDYGETDIDGDGWNAAAGDCEPTNSRVYPGAAETINGVDDDCDGYIDEGTTVYDDDGDGMTEVGGDCDDSNASVYTGAPELEDFIDNDCDGLVDDGTTRSDDDGDGYSELGGDCDDADPTRNPGEVEVAGDGIDQDCNVATGP